MKEFRMQRRYRGGRYCYLGSCGNIVSDIDTGHARDGARYEVGNYISPLKINEAQRKYFRNIYPTLSDIQIDNKIRKAEAIASSK